MLNQLRKILKTTVINIYFLARTLNDILTLIPNKILFQHKMRSKYAIISDRVLTVSLVKEYIEQKDISLFSYVDLVFKNGQFYLGDTVVTDFEKIVILGFLSYSHQIPFLDDKKINLVQFNQLISPFYRTHKKMIHFIGYPYFTNKLDIYLRLKDKLKNTYHIPTYLATKKEDIDELDLENDFEFVVKPVRGSSGNSVSKVSKNQIYNTQLNNQSNFPFIIQKLILNSSEIRVIITESEHVVTIKKTKGESSFLNNLCKGAKFEKIEPIQSLVDEAILICQILELDTGAIDFLYNSEEEKYYFIEANTIISYAKTNEIVGFNILAKQFDIIFNN